MVSTVAPPKPGRPPTASTCSSTRTTRRTPSAAYSTGDARRLLQRAGHRLFLKSAPLKSAVAGAFSLDDFAIDATGTTVTCPAGHTTALSQPSGRHLRRKALFTDQCTGCLLREECTTAKVGRIVTFRPHHAPQAATDPDWQAAHRRWRPPVERAVAWLVTHGNRSLRYGGAIKNNT
jgi:hypothetical protein